MLHKIDWLSFTMDLGNAVPVSTQYQMIEGIMDILDLTEPHLCYTLGMHDERVPAKTRAPYSQCWRWTDRFLNVYCHPRLSHVLFEISGQGIDLLYAHKQLFFVLGVVLNRITRLDIASDILCDTRPKAFAEQRDTGRFKSHSYISSASGDTYYIGAQASDRYARVYRYNAPHERHHLLRVETVLRSVNARLAAQGILERGIDYTATALGNVFGWRHPDWQPDTATDDTLRAYRPDRHMGKTEYWLSAQVAPTLRRLHREGHLNILEWFDLNVKQELDHGKH